MAEVGSGAAGTDVAGIGAAGIEATGTVEEVLGSAAGAGDDSWAWSSEIDAAQVKTATSKLRLMPLASMRKTN